MIAEAPLRPIRRSRAQPSRSRAARWYARNQRTILGLAGLFAFVAFWQVGSNSGWIDRFFFSSPADIVRAGAAELQVPRFWSDVRITAIELFGGFALAIALGIPLGIATGWYRRLGYACDPWLNLFNALPRIAIFPLILIWVGLGFQAKLLIVFLGAFFTIVIPTNQGVKTVDRNLLDVARSFRASQWRLFSAVVLPATIPFMISGVRLAVGRSLVGVIIGELAVQTDGLGVMIGLAAASLQTDRMLFAVLIFTCTGVAMTEALRRLERTFQRWRPRLEQARGAGAE